VQYYLASSILDRLKACDYPTRAPRPQYLLIRIPSPKRLPRLSTSISIYISRHLNPQRWEHVRRTPPHLMHPSADSANAMFHTCKTFPQFESTYQNDLLMQHSPRPRTSTASVRAGSRYTKTTHKWRCQENYNSTCVRRVQAPENTMRRQTTLWAVYRMSIS
jgi:hypothetical protein